MFSIVKSGAVAVTALLTGCASNAQARPITAEPLTQSAPTLTASSAQPPTDGKQPTSDVTPEMSPPQPPAPDPKTGEVPRSLPELKIKLSGMHIGGGPNDTATKRPFIEAIEHGFDAMRACYREADQPEQGGTFGVDLRVERSGGHPKLQAVRTVMKGERLKTCLEHAFLELEFGPPPKGPTVLSASIRFSLEP